MKGNNILEVSDSVKWIGILDYDIVTFDIVMETQYGTTYNSYFIDADKKVIIDTAKEKFKDEYLEKVKSVVDPSQVGYIVCNHTEPDHSGNVKNLLEIAPNATVVGSGQAINYLQEMIDVPFKSLKVKDGDVIDLGNKKLKVIGAPNLHWPDSIYTYLEDEKILFTCDSFGAHFCKEKMFDDEVENYDDAFNYYFDVILKPYSKFMLKAIEKIALLEIDTICPGHGPILRSHWKEMVERSKKMALEYMEQISPGKRKVLITYVSAYGYTREMAEIVAKGIQKVSNDFEVNVVDIENIELGELDSFITQSSGLLVGSPTINQNTLLPVYKLFAIINPLRDKGKLAASFGSYGWSGEAINIIDSNLRNLKLNVICEGASAKFYPFNEKNEKIMEFGESFAKEMMKMPVEK
ncbi:MAG: FprA family A-type flavoprotein [Bacteroidota bacterium]